MEDTLRSIIKKKGYSLQSIIAALGISRSAFYRKLNGKSAFTVNEMQKLTEILEINNPVKVFFKEKVS